MATASTRAHGEWKYNPSEAPRRLPGDLRLDPRDPQRARALLQAGLDVAVPSLVLRLDKSYFAKQYSSKTDRADAVLDVRTHAVRWAGCLGGRLTSAAIPDARHDVFLSLPAVREQAYAEVEAWLATDCVRRPPRQAAKKAAATTPPGGRRSRPVRFAVALSRPRQWPSCWRAVAGRQRGAGTHRNASRLDCGVRRCAIVGHPGPARWEHPGFGPRRLRPGRNGHPGAMVSFTDDPRLDGSGERLAMVGRTVIQVVITGAGYPGDTGVSAFTGRVDGVGGIAGSTSADRLRVRFWPTSASTRRNPVRVSTLASPTRLVIDIARSPLGLPFRTAGAVGFAGGVRGVGGIPVRRAAIPW